MVKKVQVKERTLIYTIISLGNPEREKYGQEIRRQLSYLDEVDVGTVNGYDPQSLNTAIDKHGLKINFDTWKPGEGGVWYSFINAWAYGEQHDTDILVFEDDAIIDPEFGNLLKELPLPEDYDFVSLYYPYVQGGQEMPFKLAEAQQEHGNVCILYSAQGCKKIMQMLRDEGLEWPVDIWLFKKSKFEKTLNGYSQANLCKRIVTHDNKNPSNIHDGERINVYHTEGIK